MSEYDFPPKKRPTTYGKATKRRTPQTSGGVSRNGDSTTEISAASAASTSPSSSPEPQSRPRLTTSTSSRENHPTTTKTARPTRPRPPEQAHSQPLSHSSSATNFRDDEDVGIKKRKLTRTYSERQDVSVDPYAIPDSPPLRAQSPARKPPAKNARGNTVRTEKPSRVPKPPPRSPTTTPEKDVQMKDVSPQQMPFSAKISKASDNGDVNSGDARKSDQQIPLRLSREQPLLSRPVDAKQNSPPPRSLRVAASTSTAPRKKRLIDALAEQADEDEEEEEEEEEEAESQPSQLSTASQTAVQKPEFTFRDLSPPPGAASQASRTAVRPVTAAKKAGPKFTYSQQRTMLAEDDPLLGGVGLASIDENTPHGAVFSLGRLPKVSTINAFAFLDEDDETVNTGAVRSLHELRQAGANSRFADEMDDIMDRIGSPSAKPSSLRRGALLELAQKMKEKEFRRQFRNHSGDGNLFKSLGDETDLVSGYSILTILVTLLAASSSAHLVQQLRKEDFAALLSRLLLEATDIAVLAKDRKQNCSKHAQATLGNIRSSTLTLPIWEPATPTSLSPRTLALKCLDLIMRQPNHLVAEAEALSPVVADQLFSILSMGAASEACWTSPSQRESTDFYLALYVLESHSISVMQSDLGVKWTRQYVPIVVDVLDTALRRPVETFNDLENLTLRITLNMTNNNANAARVFVDRGLLRKLVESACGAFESVLNSMKVDAFQDKVNESLIMMLGVMINFCVYYPPASQSLEEAGDGSTSSLNRLIRVFAENHAKTSDADSMEKTQLNVALGYLSILLGYLCLLDPIRERFLLVHPKKTTQPLLDSINEFIAFHHKIARDAGARADSDFGAMARLQGLTEQLNLHNR